MRFWLETTFWEQCLQDDVRSRRRVWVETLRDCPVVGKELKHGQVHERLDEAVGRLRKRDRIVGLGSELQPGRD